MIRRPPGSTRTDTLFPDTTLFRSAWLDGKRLHLRYLNRDHNECTERSISPQQLVHYRENWMLDAWCHTRNAIRSFALEAIEDVRVVNEAALEVSQDEMQEHFRSGYGIFAGQAAQRRSEEHTSELQSLMRISYAVFCLKKKKNKTYK